MQKRQKRSSYYFVPNTYGEMRGKTLDRYSIYGYSENNNHKLIKLNILVLNPGGPTLFLLYPNLGNSSTSVMHFLCQTMFSKVKTMVCTM